MRAAAVAALFAGLLSGADAEAQLTHVWIADVPGSAHDELCSGRFSDPADVANCWYGPGRPGAPREGSHTCVINQTNGSSVNPPMWTLTLTNCGPGTFFTRWNMYCPPAEGSPNGTGSVWGQCIVPPEKPCEEAAGRKFGRNYEDTETRGAVCITVGTALCRADPVGVHACIRGVCYGDLKVTGERCTFEPNPAEDETLEPDPPTENCISTGKMSLCYRSDEKNCGWVNGERWCAPESMREGCISTESGAMVCVGDAGPVDETGELLPADEEFITGHGAGAGTEPGHDREWRYYARDTVASGSGVVRTSRPSEGDVGEGVDDGAGEYPGLEDGESWSESMDGFWARVQDTPWGQALSVSGIPEGGECPTATFDFFGEEMTISAHCELIEEFSGLLGIVCLFGWSLLGVRIILSA